MASREYNIALRVLGSLDPSLVRSLQQAQTNLQNLGRMTQSTGARLSQLHEQQVRAANQSEQIRQYQALKAAMNETVHELSASRRNVEQLRAAWQQNQAQTNAMRQSLQQLRAEYSQNRASMTAAERASMQSQIQSARQALQAQQQLTRQSQQAFNSQNSTTSRLSSQLEQQRARLLELRSALTQAGVNVNQLAAEEQRLQAQISATNTQLQAQSRLGSAQVNMSNASERMGFAYGNLQNAVGTAQSIMAPFTSAIQVATDFEAQMSQVGAITGAQGAMFDALRTKAEQLGASTAFSASQSAAAMTELGRAGWSSQQILEGIGSTLSLAAAGGTDLATTANIMSGAMNAFQLSGTEAAQRVADVFATTANRSATTVQLLGDTMRYAGGVAGSVGYQIEDVAFATALMAKQNIAGSEAGTALRSIMTRLSKPPAEAARALQQLGIQAANADGTMKPLAGVLTELRSKFAGLTDEQRIQAANAIAGQEAMAGLLAIVNGSDADFGIGEGASEGLLNLIRNSSGVASQTAAQMQNNFKGAMTGLDSALEGASIAIGNVFLPALTAAAKAATNLTSSFIAFANENPALVQWAGLFAAGLSAVVVGAAGVQLAFAGWGFITSAISLASAAVTAFATRIGGLTVVQYAASAATAAWTAVQTAFNAVMAMNPVGLAVVAVVALVAAIGAAIALCPGLSEALSGAWNNPAGAITGFAELMKSTVDGAINYVLARWETFKQALSHPIDAVMNFAETGSVVGGNVQEGGAILQSQAVQVDTTAAQAEVTALGQAASQTAANLSAVDLSQATAAADMANLQMSTQMTGAEMTNLQMATQMAGTDMTNLQMATQMAGTDMANLQMQNQAAAMDMTNLQMSTQMTGTEMTNLQMQSQMVGTEFTNLQMASQTTGTEMLNLGQTASSIGAGLQSLDSAAANVASALNSKAAQISSITISVPKVNVAANAEGGIYKQGAFLTTFAEKSPEAAIPLDGSQHAIDLWQAAGQILGAFQPETRQAVSFEQPAINIPQPLSIPPAVNVSQPVINIPAPNILQPAIKPELPELAQSPPQITNNSTSENSVSRETFSPSIVINVSNGVEGIRQAGEDLARQLDQWWENKMHEQRRRSFA